MATAHTHNGETHFSFSRKQSRICVHTHTHARKRNFWLTSSSTHQPKPPYGDGALNRGGLDCLTEYYQDPPSLNSTKEACITKSALSCMHYDATAAPLRSPPTTNRDPEGVLSTKQLKQSNDQVQTQTCSPIVSLSLQHFHCKVRLQISTPTAHFGGTRPTDSLRQLADVGRHWFMGYTLNFNLGVTCFFLASPICALP